MTKAVASARLGSVHAGTSGWLVQRLTSLYLAGFVVFIAIEFVRADAYDFASWRAWWDSVPTRAAAGVFIISLLLHAWVGMRSIFLDYLKPVWLRLAASVATALLLVLLALWGVRILLML